MNKQINQDLKNQTTWLNPYKICLNAGKTEDFFSKLSRKFRDVPLKLKLIGKRLYPQKTVKYLGINIDENLHWKLQISDIAIKLGKAIGILSKLSQNFIDRTTLKSKYHALFEPHLYYSFFFVWVQNSNST